MEMKSEVFTNWKRNPIFILSAEMNLADVFLVEIKIVIPLTLPTAVPPDAQRESYKEATCGPLSWAAVPAIPDKPLPERDPPAPPIVSNSQKETSEHQVR